MQHHHDVRAFGERQRIAGLLIATVTAIRWMPMRLDAKPRRDRDGGIVARVIDEQHHIDDIVRNRGVAGFERLLRVVGGHHDDDFISMEHAGIIPSEVAKLANGRSRVQWRPREDLNL